MIAETVVRHIMSTRRLLPLALLNLPLLSLCQSPLPAASQQIASSTSELEIGVLDQPTYEAFGKIDGIVADSSGNIYVLDGINQSLRAFDSRGQFLAEVGGSGQGPEEFGAELSLDLDSTGLVLVADPHNLRISAWRLHEGQLELVRTDRLAIPGVDLCVSGSHRFVLVAVPSPALVREVSSDGGVLQAFAAPIDPPRPYDNVVPRGHPLLNSASFGCDTTGASVAVMHRFVPVVRLFGQDGMERWKVSLAEYKQMGFKQDPPGRCCAYGFPAERGGAFHTGATVVVDGSHVVLSLYKYDSNTKAREYELRVLDVNDGREINRTRAPGILWSVREGRAYLSAPSPFPRVLVYPWRSASDR